MSQFSQANKKHIAALKKYAAEVLRQYEDKENDLLKAENTLEEIKEMRRIYPEDEELLHLFESHSLTVERVHSELTELATELEAAKTKLKSAMLSQNKAASDVAMQTVEHNMQAAGLELPRVSPVASQMKEGTAFRCIKANGCSNGTEANASDAIEGNQRSLETLPNAVQRKPYSRFVMRRRLNEPF